MCSSILVMVRPAAGEYVAAGLQSAKPAAPPLEAVVCCVGWKLGLGFGVYV